MTCIDCENFYTQDCMKGLCHDDLKVHQRTDVPCDHFIPRKKDIIPMLDYIARKIPYWDLVLFEDGAPLFTLTKELSVNQIEIVLRSLCRPDKEYSIVEFKGGLYE